MWLRPQGHAFITSPDAGTVNLDGFQRDRTRAGLTEYDTVTCAHCNRVFHIKPRQRPDDLGGLCKICMRLICPKCLNHGCRPFEEKIAADEQRDAIRRLNGMI